MAQDINVPVPTRTYPSKNVLSELRVYSMTEEPLIVLGYTGAVPEMEADGVTPKLNALGKARHTLPDHSWEYTRAYSTSDPLALAAVRQALGLSVFLLVKQAFIEASVTKTDAEVQALVVALGARGVDLWWSIERAAMSMEDRIRSGDALGQNTTTLRGAGVMKLAGIPTT